MVGVGRQSTRIDRAKKITIKMGNVDFGRKAQGKVSSNALQRVGRKCSVASPSNASPSQSPVGLEQCIGDTETRPLPSLLLYYGDNQ